MTTALATRTSTAPAPDICVTCGAFCTYAYVCTQAGHICYACAGALELAAFDENPARWSGYITHDNRIVLRDGRVLDGWEVQRRWGLSQYWQGAIIATWTGEPIAIVTQCKATRRRVSEWVGECVYSVKVRNPRTGAEYRGLTYGPGMYVSLTRTTGGRTK